MPPREPELYKDKVEVSLDGRQIFYLFFGGAVIVGIVFVLGVLVGRRVEARGHVDRAKTHAATDPLAALDRLEGNGQLSFRASLAAGKEQPTDVEKEIERRAVVKPEAKKPEAKAVAKPEAKKVEDKPVAKPEATSEAKDVAKPEATSEDKPVTKPDAAKAEAKPEEPKESKARYTLQLSAFQDKAEAEAFLSTVKTAGYQAQITQAEVEGKGTFDRVRMGSYRSMDAANEAKSEFEKGAKQSASVMRL